MCSSKKLSGVMLTVCGSLTLFMPDPPPNEGFTISSLKLSVHSQSLLMSILIPVSPEASLIDLLYRV